MGNFKIAVSY